MNHLLLVFIATIALSVYYEQLRVADEKGLVEILHRALVVSVVIVFDFWLIWLIWSAAL